MHSEVFFKGITLQKNELFPQAVCSPTLLKKKKKKEIPLFSLKVSLQIIVSEVQITEETFMKPCVGKEM